MPFCISLDFLSLHHGQGLQSAKRMSFFFFSPLYLLFGNLPSFHNDLGKKNDRKLALSTYNAYTQYFS